MRVGRELGFLPRLRGLGGLDHRVAVGLGLGDLRVAFDLGDARLAQRVEVALAVADVADGEADDAQAHVRHVAGGHFLHLRGEGIAVLVDVLHRHRAEDRAQMAFQGLHGDVLDLLGALAQELLGGGGDGDVVALDLDLRHAIHAHRHAFAGVNLRLLCTSMVSNSSERRSTFSMTGQTKVPPPLTMRKPRICTVPSGSVIAVLAAGDDQHFVRADLGVAAGPDGREDHDDDDQADDHHGDGAQAAESRFGEEDGMIWHR